MLHPAAIRPLSRKHYRRLRRAIHRERQLPAALGELSALYLSHMKALNLKWRVTIGAVAVLLVAVGALFVLFSGPRPLCHRAIDGTFQQWMLENGRTNVYPNANGMGSNSLAIMVPFFGQDSQRYQYVP